MSLISQSKNIIESYGDGNFFIRGREYCGSIIIFPEEVIKVKEVDINSIEHFKQFLVEGVEVLLVGTGKTRAIPNLSVKSYLIGRSSLNFEFMTTDAACRTHNILISEDRFVITYLLVI